MRLIIVSFTLILALAAVLQACGSAAVVPWSNQPLGMFSDAATNAAREIPVDLNVFAAASLTEPFREIGAAFEAANPGIRVVFNFASSHQLAHQLAQGAPADVFASANELQMEIVIDSGFITPGTDRPFAKNRLAIAVPKDNPAGILALQDLARDDVLLVLAAESAPVGRYSLEFLDKTMQDAALGEAYKVSVLNNVVSYEGNVKAVLNKVVLGEADAGIVYTSDLSAENADQVIRINIPNALNVTATYPIAAIGESPNPELAMAFIDYVLSPDAQAILSRHGFTPFGQR